MSLHSYNEMFNNISRDFALKIHYILDQLLPPFLRDCRWLMIIPLWLLYQHRYKAYLDFKEKALAMSEDEFREFYRLVSDTAVKRETDLNKASIAAILSNLSNIAGEKILDAGCGNGFLANLLSDNYQVTAVDIIIDPELCSKYPAINFQAANVEALPFADKYFDMVICAHTLEHVRDIHAAIGQLRRVAKKIIIVVPRQRPYKYSFDLHLNFFPYLYSLPAMIGKSKGSSCVMDVDGDIFYMEESAE